ncbi:MAG: VOC family protein [Bryobacteraceae bacterium]
MRTLLSCILLVGLCSAEDLPITRLAGMHYMVKDMERTQQFYTGVLGLERAFEAPCEADGAVCAYFKLNDDQYMVFSAGAVPAEGFRLRGVAMLTPDAATLRAMLEQRGLKPDPVRKGADGSLHVVLADPFGMPIDFVEYAPGSLQARNRGKFLGPRRVTEQLYHAAIAVEGPERGMAFYRDKLGFKESMRGGPNQEIRWINMDMPGTRINGDYIEQMVHTAFPASARQHICFAAADMQAAYKAIVANGLSGGFKPFLATNNHWIMNLKDPHGIRVEMMEPHEAKTR